MLIADKSYDVVIIGGGLIGASLLLALQNSNLKIALIESNKHETRVEPVLDQRSLVLSLGSKLYFESLGVWPSIAPHATLIKKIKVSEVGKFAKVTIDQQSLNVPALGYVINIQLLNKAIWDSLGSLENIDVYCPCRLENLQQSSSEVVLNLKQGESNVNITAKIVVAADGAKSYVRSLLGISSQQHNYQQIALIANVQHEFPNNGIAYERFSQSGPFAILPREHANISGVVWPWDANQLEYLKNLPDQQLLNQMQKLFGYKLGKITSIGARQFFPLWKISSDQLFQDRVVLLGSAANTIHPIGGQGFNLGLRDVQNFTTLLLSQAYDLNSGSSIQELLSNYVDSRIDDHADLVNGTHNLLGLFASHDLGIKLFRNFSMVIMNHSLMLRTLIADKSMGLA